MKDQHTKIKGYRDLSEAEIQMMNVVKGMANEVGDLIERLGREENVDPRWLAIAQTDLQKGFMSLVRSFAKPESF